MEEKQQEEKPQEEKTKRGFFKDSNRLLSLSAIFISAGTLFILMYQTHLASRQFDLQQRQQVASVMPYIHIGTAMGDTEGFSIVIENLGLGPAFVRQVNVHYKDSVYEGYDIYRVYDRVLKPEGYSSFLSVYANVLKGSVIPSGKHFEHVKMKFAKDGPRDFDDILMTNKVQLEIVYASIYGETWSVKGNFNEPVKLDEPE